MFNGGGGLLTQLLGGHVGHHELKYFRRRNQLIDSKLFIMNKDPNTLKCVNVSSGHALQTHN